MALAERSPPSPAQDALVRFLASHPDTTSRTYRRALELVPLCLYGTRDLGSVPWDRIDYATGSAIRERLAKRYRPTTVNRTLAALRGLARELARQGAITLERRVQLEDVKDIRHARTRAKAGRALDPDEQQRIMAQAGMEPAPRFHRALVALLLAGGLRKAEAATFLTSDFSDYSGGRLRVHGKGGKERVVYFAGVAAAALDEFVSADDRGWRFRKLGTSQIGLVVRRLEQRSRVAHLTPHDCRRTYISTQFSRGVDISTLQRLAGHASPVQTTAYDRRADDRLRAAAWDPWAKETLTDESGARRRYWNRQRD